MILVITNKKVMQVSLCIHNTYIDYMVISLFSKLQESIVGESE